MSKSRTARHERLRETLRENPFLTDYELARQFGVSVQTIRLDRMALGIPELRMRTKTVAERVHGLVKSMGAKEIVGELVDIQLGKSAVSILETTSEMAFERSGVVRGHYIFAQADSLAIALVDADTVLTGLANVKYKRPARVGERLVARAEVIRQLRGQSSVVLVVTRAAGEHVFRGKFTVFALESPGQLQEEVES
ncbi:MAG: transcription factor FapR [Bacillota bacterium]